MRWKHAGKKGPKNEGTYAPLAETIGEGAALGDADPKSSSQLLYRYPDRPTEEFDVMDRINKWEK